MTDLEQTKSNHNMNIAIFGASGIVGKAIVKEALQRGHSVTVLTRSVKNIGIRHEQLRIVEGCVTDRNAVRTVLEGQDAVIQTLGIGGKGDGSPTTFVSEANSLIMEEMKKLELRRLIAISVIGAGDSARFLPWIYKKMVMPLFMRWLQAIIDDKNRMETAIEQSGLDWTVVRCTTVKDCPAVGKVNATLDGKGIKYSIAAPDMAAFFVEQLSDDRFLKQMPTISN